MKNMLHGPPKFPPKFFSSPKNMSWCYVPTFVPQQIFFLLSPFVCLTSTKCINRSVFPNCCTIGVVFFFLSKNHHG